MGDSTDTSNWAEAADYSGGEIIPFELVGTVIGKLDQTETCYYEFTDQLASGLTYLGDFEVFLLNQDDTQTDDERTYTGAEDEGSDLIKITDKFKLTRENSGNSVRFSCADISQIEDININSKIIVRYNTVLNSSTMIAGGSESSASLKCNASTSAEVSTTIYTYQLSVHKTNANGVSLQDAYFKLKNEDGKYAVCTQQFQNGTVNGLWQVTDWSDSATSMGSDSSGLIDIIGLDSGTYYLEEVQAPEGYSCLTEPQELRILYTGNSLDPLTNSAIKLVLISDITEDIPTETIEQIKNDMYASVPDDSFTVTTSPINHSADCTVVNNRIGYVLPTTGGMGTTIFYVLGSILVLGSAVLLIVKKRMKNEN
jgi:fimbrial isopeptide formation D2 family protein/LPXTG-motif cell wall-anchored protein